MALLGTLFVSYLKAGIDKEDKVKVTEYLEAHHNKIDKLISS